MSNVAILGHATRGKEVIEILEMLGGANIYSKSCSDSNLFCYLSNAKHICELPISESYREFTLFTLEEFLERFPYKVGDKVQFKWATSCGSVYEVEKMRWVDNEIEYTIKRLWYWNDHYTVTAQDLQIYKEETMEGKIESFEVLESHCANEVKIEFDPSKFEIVKRDNGYYVVKKQPQYPKTYEECCDVLNVDVSRTIEHSEDCPFYRDITCYEYDLLSRLAYLRKLLICRNAYWKIIGEQMGLGKPWEPDWSNGLNKFCLLNCENRIIKSAIASANIILAFPTEEIRDMFYENFKDLIETCKELL